MVPNDLNPSGYDTMVIVNPMMGGASRYLRITAVEGADFQSFISSDHKIINIAISPQFPPGIPGKVYGSLPLPSGGRYQREAQIPCNIVVPVQEWAMLLQGLRP